MQEIWRSIPFGDRYEVSNHGHLRNTKTRKLLSGTINEDGYLRVYLSDGVKHKSFYLHKLVAEAFLGPCPPGLQVRHWDGNPLNNKITNLLYGTPSQNVYDTVRYGNHFQARKTHCLKDHEYTEENTYIHPNGARSCRICLREAFKRHDKKRKRVTVNGKRVWVKISQESSGSSETSSSVTAALKGVPTTGSRGSIP